MTPVPRRKAAAQAVTTDTSDTVAPRRESRTASDGPPPPPGGPPPKTAAPGGTPKQPAKSGGARAPLQKSLEELFSAPAYIYALNGDTWAEDHISTTAPRLAEAWYKLAQKNPAVKRTLESLTTGSAWGGVAVATGATVLPLLAHHRLLPGQVQVFFSGVPTTGTPSGPIVPPPPGAMPGPPPVPPGGGGTPSPSRWAKMHAEDGPTVPPPGGGMTPPMAPGAPPGVVTVAASNNRAVMLDG